MNESTSERETWVEWVQRVTTEARQIMADHNIPHWVDEQAARMRRWSARVNTMESERWAKQVLSWQPEGYRSRDTHAHGGLTESSYSVAEA